MDPKEKFYKVGVEVQDFNSACHMWSWSISTDDTWEVI